MDNMQGSSLFGQSSARGDHRDSAGERERNFYDKPLTIPPEHPMRIDDNVTEIDTEVEEDVGANEPNRSKSRSRRNVNLRHTKIEPLETKLDFFLNQPLLYCQDPRFSDEAAFQDIPDAHWCLSSV